MTVNYTTLLGLAKPVSGTEAGTWGDTVNNNLTDYLDSAVAGAQIISGSLTAVTLSKTTGASLSQAGAGATGSSQYQIIRCTGNPASLLTITVPAADKTYVVINATSTSQSVKIVGAGPTTGVTILSGKTSIVAWKGTDFVEISPSTANKVISNKTAAYTVVADDLGKIINCTANTFTVSLTAAATLGSGFTCTIWNTSTTYGDIITILPASGTIDGVASISLSVGEGTDIVCDGTNWETSYKKTMRGYAESIVSTAGRPTALYGGVAIGVGSTVSIGAYTASVGCIALGGAYATNADAFAACINSNTTTYGAQNSSAIAIGRTTKSTGAGSIAMGRSITATADSTIAMGYLTDATGTYSIALGLNATTNGIYGKFSHASGVFSGALSNRGEAQFGRLVLRAATTTTTAVVLTSNGAAASTTNQIILATGQAMAISGTLIAKQTASGNMAGWTITGIVSNNAGTMAVSGLALTAIGTDSIGLGAAPTIAVDNTNLGVKITSGYKSATSIRWVATVQTSEVTYA